MAAAVPARAATVGRSNSAMSKFPFLATQAALLEGTPPWRTIWRRDPCKYKGSRTALPNRNVAGFQGLANVFASTASAAAHRTMPLVVAGAAAAARVRSRVGESGLTPGEEGPIAQTLYRPRNPRRGRPLPSRSSAAASHGARWIDPENYHITLRFIGDVDHPIANEVTDALDRLANSEAFHDQAQPSRARSAATSRGRSMPASRTTPALQRLQAAQERVLQRLGLEPEGRKFTPHVTLARLRGTVGRGSGALHGLRRALRAARVPGRPLRPVLEPGFGRRRALSRRADLSARRLTASRPSRR